MKLNKMQPIVFSHGLSGHRMVYSTLFMELASCGYCVIALSHNDGSADYTPKASQYKGKVEMYDYQMRNKQV
jgi:predicted dienelactone hydrolase